MDQSNPVISIITPTFNRSDELDHLIESINNQTLDHKYFEMIISDDGSKDDTEKKIMEWSKIVDFNLKSTTLDHSIIFFSVSSFEPSSEIIISKYL